MGRKLLFLIADGMGDWPLAELGGRTPLQAAATPQLDALASSALAGVCRTVPPGLPPGSDVANMSLLGFDPRRWHTGRGPIEAAAQGLELHPDDLVWRMNLVTVSEFSDQGIMRDYSAGHIDTATAHRLIARLQERLGNAVFRFHPGVQYRHLLVQQGGATSSEAVLTINPPHDITDQPLAPDMAVFAASERLQRLVREAAVLLADSDNPSRANAVWPWGQGRPLHLEPFAARFGLRGAVISAVDLLKGLGRAADMAVPEVPGATGLLDTNYAGKVAAALAFLEQGDFVFLHVEAPDECGHGGDLAGKVEAIRRFDEHVVGPLRQALPEAVFLVACDHFTPLSRRTHVSDPAPFLLSWPEAPAGYACFDERVAQESGLTIEPGHELMDWTLRTAGIR